MPRIIKHPSIRRAELLAVAQQLFFEHGYDATSVDSLIARAGLSKGAFYYYFPSKEALLEALSEDIANQSLEQIKDILKDPVLNALERLNAFLTGARRLKAEQGPEILKTFAAVFRPENIVLYHRTHMAVSRVMSPVLAQIIAQGTEEGTFRSSDPKATADILLNLGAISHDVVADLLAAKGSADFKRASAAFERRLIEQGIAVDRILGLPDGSIHFIEPGFVEAVFASGMQHESDG